MRAPAPRSLRTLVAPADVVITLDPKAYSSYLIQAIKDYLDRRPEGEVVVALDLLVDGLDRELRFGRRVDGVSARDIAAIIAEHRHG